MKVKSKVKAGESGLSANHNQSVKGLRVKSSVRTGGPMLQHNQTVKGLLVRSGVRSGGPVLNHNQTVTR